MVLKLPCDFAKKIAESLGLQMQGVDTLFTIDEDKAGYFVAKLKPKQFLEKENFRTMCALVRDLGGEGYLAGAKMWRVPGPFAKPKSPSGKEMDSEAAYKAPENAILTASSSEKSPNSIDEEIVASLKGSAAKVGYLYPVLVDASGNTIDGFHRRKANPNWPTYLVEFVLDPLQLAKARLIANERRNVPAEEKKSLLDEIAKMTGWTPKQIAEDLGWSERTMYRYLSSEHKNQTKAEAGRLGGSADSLSAGMDKSVSNAKLQLTCARCGLPIEGAPVHLGEGKYYDAECAEAVVEEAKSGHGPSIEPGSGAEEVGKEEDECKSDEEGESRITEDRKGEVEASKKEKVEEKSSRQEDLKAIGIGEFECTECHKRFLVEHMKNGKHRLKPIREADEE